jgi:hypothetical protein
MEEKTCPKCGSRMLSDKILGSGAVETSLFTEASSEEMTSKLSTVESAVSLNFTELRISGFQR